MSSPFSPLSPLSPDMPSMPSTPSTPETQESTLNGPKYRPLPDGLLMSRFVRFLIPLAPPPSPEDTETGSNTARSDSSQGTLYEVVVAPCKDSTIEPAAQFESGSGWTREELRRLGVHLYMKKPIDLDRVLCVNDDEWTPEMHERKPSSSVSLIQGVEKGVQELGSVNIKDVSPEGISLDEVVENLAPHFGVTFISLLEVMKEETGVENGVEPSKLDSEAIRPSDVPLLSASTTPLKRPSSSPAVDQPVSMKRQRPDNDSDTLSPTFRPSTSTQPTLDLNDFGDTAYSRDFTAFHPESSTTKLIYNFVTSIQGILLSEFRRLKWPTTRCPVEIKLTESSLTRFTLGAERVEVINDGGLGISCNPGGFIRWKDQPEPTSSTKGSRPQGPISVLSFETKEFLLNDKDDGDRYAAQIFCEMLGQTCHEEFYNNALMEYQEAFVIHGSDSFITIYYAKFPNIYLREIAKHGFNFLTQSELCNTRILFRRSKKYRMQMTKDRVDLFRVLVKLFWYLISGRSRVGYLYNYAENPLHRIYRILRMMEAV